MIIIFHLACFVPYFQWAVNYSNIFLLACPRYFECWSPIQTPTMSISSLILSVHIFNLCVICLNHDNLPSKTLSSIIAALTSLYNNLQCNVFIYSCASILKLLFSPHFFTCSFKLPTCAITQHGCIGVPEMVGSCQVVAVGFPSGDPWSNPRGKLLLREL